MFGMPVREAMERRKLLKATPDTTVTTAAKLLADWNAGAVMVLAGSRLVGIFTERDVVFRVVAAGRNPDTTCVGEVMTPDPQTIGPDQLFGRALIIMHENKFRHLPVLEEGRLIGVVSARSAMDPDLEEFTVEAGRRKRFLRPT